VGGGLIALLIGAAAVRLFWPTPADDTGTEPAQHQSRAPTASLPPAAPAIALPVPTPPPNAAEDRTAEAPAGDSRTTNEPLSPPAAAPAPIGKPATPSRPRASPGPSTAATGNTTATAAAPREDPPAPAPEPAAPAAPPASADERCADRSNFITRDLCRIQACRDPALVADPVCVRFRAMEQANRNRGTD